MLQYPYWSYWVYATVLLLDLLGLCYSIITGPTGSMLLYYYWTYWVYATVLVLDILGLRYSIITGHTGSKGQYHHRVYIGGHLNNVNTT